jgi:predicted NACHT family NTPase
VELYQEICELQLGRRPSARGIALVLNSISQRQEVLQFVALEMMFGAVNDSDDKEGFKQIQLYDLLEFVTIALLKIDRDVNPREFITQIEQVSELLVKRDGNIYQFSHLSFQEFLAAAELVRLKVEGERLIYERLNVSAWKDKDDR